MTADQPAKAADAASAIIESSAERSLVRRNLSKNRASAMLQKPLPIQSSTLVAST
jgi:hypothetical protein